LSPGAYRTGASTRHETRAHQGVTNLPRTALLQAPTTEQILRLFSLAERHTLLREAKPIQTFPPRLSELQRQTLDLLGVPEHAFLAS
jgi:hypothetical protein